MHRIQRRRYEPPALRGESPTNCRGSHRRTSTLIGLRCIGQWRRGIDSTEREIGDTPALCKPLRLYHFPCRAGEHPILSLTNSEIGLFPRGKKCLPNRLCIDPSVTYRRNPLCVLQCLL